MKSKTSSIRSISSYLPQITKLGEFRIVAKVNDLKYSLEELGVTDQGMGVAFIPQSVGNATTYNSEGKIIVRKDLPKIPESYMSWREWEDWHGQTHYGVQYRTMNVYPRERVLPPSEYLEIVDFSGCMAISSKVLKITENTEPELINIINIFLEISGTFEFASPDFTKTANSVKRLNWRVLPEGKYPFNKAKEALSGFLEKLNESQKPVVSERIRVITQKNPEFLAIGVGGFSTYVVFGFPKKNIYILESPNFGNATYILKGNWESISILSKKEILDNNLHHARIIHNRSWPLSLNKFLT